MRVSGILVCGLFTAISVKAVACTVPPLVNIPDDAKSQAEKVQQEFKDYYDKMKGYTACIQNELTAAGGDNAPKLTKMVLVARNNAAVAEVEAVRKQLDAAMSATPTPTTAEPKAGKDEDSGRHHRDRK